jgi:3-methyladenine DNA glycosylase AlkD
MKMEKVLAQLEALGTDGMRQQNIRQGARANQFGVRLGDIRKLAKTIEQSHEFALALWETEIIDARLLSILLKKPQELSSEEMDRMVRSVTFVRVADWLNSYIVKKHPDKEALRQMWMTADAPMAARAGWNLTDERVAKAPEGLDPVAQWTMNFTLVGIGIHSPNHRKRSMAIGEKLGVYRDYPVSKGCTSPFAPIRINEMVKRQGRI